MAPFSVDVRKPPQPSRREIEISKVIREALEPALILEEYPRTAIDVYLEVLQADGGSRCAGITASAVALADAGISMRDMVVACAAGKVSNQVVLDLSDVEDKEGDADMPIAIMPNLNQLTLLQLDGVLTSDEFERAFEMAVNACRTIYEVQRKALMDKYFGKAEAGEE
jgi:exosome complex component RRP41